jgi:hypothetical protein
MTFVLHQIKNINLPLDSITFTESNHTYNLTVKLEDSSRYVYSIDNNTICCEQVGFFVPKTQFVNEAFKVGQDESKKRVILRSAELSGQLLTTLVFNCNELDECPFRDSGGMATMELIFANGEVFEFGYYNCHNGYYNHRLWLNLFERNDDTSMNIFTSSI